MGNWFTWPEVSSRRLLVYKIENVIRRLVGRLNLFHSLSIHAGFAQLVGFDAIIGDGKEVIKVFRFRL